jgi:3-deoxy-D-manno-octulosonic-acid transferase
MNRPDPLLFALNLSQILGALLLLWQKKKRFQARGDAYEWDRARWQCQCAVPEGDGPHVVFVTMGFAETRQAVQLADQLREQRPTVRVSFAIRNRAAAEEGGAIPVGANVVPMPFDFALPVRRWMKSGRFDVVVLVERFWFANLVRGAFNAGAQLVAVAARTRDHRGSRYKLGAFYNRWILNAFQILCVRSPEEKAKLGDALPATLDVRPTGSLKFWPRIPALPTEQRESLRQWLALAGEKPLLAAGSTQPGDEEWIMEAFAPLQKQYGAVLLLAPRNASRADEAAAAAQKQGLTIARRSQGIPITPAAPEVLLLDTLGELVTSYGACRAAFIGGTIRGTGHNVLEPVAHGIPVFFGPKRGTFGAEQQLCEEAGVGFRVASPDELRQGWEQVLRDHAWRDEVKQKAEAFNAQGARAWQETVNALVEVCDRGERAPH